MQLVLNQDLRNFEDYRGFFGLGVMLIHRGLLFIPFFCRDAMPRVFFPIGFNINLPATLVFESGFSGFRGLQRTSLV